MSQQQVYDLLSLEGVPTRFSYQQLRAATSNFSEKLGSGAIGTVYKGALGDKTMVAVKLLASQVDKQFDAEVAAFGRMHHVNLVRFHGYCVERNHRALVYEYMAKGSLEKVLYAGKNDDGNEELHHLSTRLDVALGVARGIAYLHEECHECILHYILLDGGCNPKVADFGMAKLVARDEARALTVTTIQGTRGYMAPEWIGNMPITVKVDTYSFGMVLLELLTGRARFLLDGSPGTSFYPFWAFEKCKDQDMEGVADPRLIPNGIDWRRFEKALLVALWCIQLDATSRPTMGKVVKMLEEDDKVIEPPPFPM